MLKAFRANLVADLIFYRRNRMVALVAVFIGIIWCTMLLPSLLFMSVRDKFQIIKMLIEQSQWFVIFFVAALAVMTLAYNFNQRCFKMVITKPCPSEVWLAAHYTALLLVAAVLHAILLTAALILFTVWHIPLQWGVFYLVGESFLTLMLIVSVLSFLVTVMHPFLAVILMSLINESTFYNLLMYLLAAATHATTAWAKFGYGVGNTVIYALYLIVPSYSLFEKKVAGVHTSLRMGWGDLKWLGLTALYTVLVCGLLFVLTALALRRRRHT